MRVLFTGGRDFTDRKLVWSAFDDLTAHGMTHMCEGGAAGLDTIAREVAKVRGVWCVTFWAPWRNPVLGKEAGPARNRFMLETFAPDAVAAFPGGTGTAHMVKLANLAGIRVWRFPYTGN